MWHESLLQKFQPFSHISNIRVFEYLLRVVNENMEKRYGGRMRKKRESERERERERGGGGHQKRPKEK